MLRLHQRPLFEPPAKIHLDVVSSHVRELDGFEGLSQMLQCPLVNRVRLFRAKRLTSDLFFCRRRRAVMPLRR
jgi:hypothetical protein